MIRRLLRLVAVAAVLLIAAAALLQTFEAGRVLTVRQLVRLERRWNAYFPIVSGREFLRHREPMLTRLGLLEPVTVEIEPGVRMRLDPSDWISRNILINRRTEWEPEVWAVIEEALSPGAVFLDVGAHIGYDSLKAARRVGEDGRVVAFEPNPATAAQLRANMSASGITNINVQEVACADVETQLTFFDSSEGGNSGTSSMAASNAGNERRSFVVRARPIDAVVAELGLGRVDVIKADVEGAELLVMRGALQTLQRFRPRLILEVVPGHLAGMGATVEELERLLAQNGYVHSRQIDPTNRLYWADPRQ